ncbi:unnamed protein product [Clonostachys rosea f. rosea IK726]|uniref:Uncharacterized protein n=1 Tax=Clonostachys rosea f. rosea IK726 TaxID=1349383 RepID=A0ACA9T7I4_BIOOC|nr:unnamed protein product [Clonostachys rosea f. rosea IK726]
MANNVTDQPNGTAAHGISENDTLSFSYGYESISGSQSLLTYKSHSLAVQVGTAPGVSNAVPCAANVAEEFTIGEGAA